MDPLHRIHRQIMLWRHLPAAVIAMTVLVLGLTIAMGARQLRQSTRAQMMQREADILHSVALMQHLSGQSQDWLGAQLEDTADQFNLALQISQLKDVVAARIYDRHGAFLVAFPAYIKDAALPDSDVAALRQLRPLAHYDARRTLSDLILDEFKSSQTNQTTDPVMEVAIPLHRMNDESLLGIIQFIMDGRPIEKEFAALDRNLLQQALLAWVMGGGLVAIALGWTFRNLRRSNVLLMERTENLQRANEELATAARTSALGAVTAHLLHGLSNPLSGLQDFMAQHRQDASPDDDEWRHAVLTTRRMRELVTEATRVLTEEYRSDRYELSLDDIVATLETKCGPLAARHGVALRTDVTGQANLTNRQSNLLGLILENLLTNAVQATPAQRTVGLEVRRDQDRLIFDVHDAGTGIPDPMQKKLFKPCRSTKEEGSGIGLAICQQLANHLGASLRLQSTGPTGSIFRLELPLQVTASRRDLVVEET